ncbi:hypothetical protein AAG570_007691 [Ranatra chinensis]|uniref:Cyclin-dependent kinase inhibitor domain-containing protein n=1 Tax=Ranatra chinensis TaxID=642074 RepID=A0ABD0XVK6_9HEMI
MASETCSTRKKSRRRRKLFVVSCSVFVGPNRLIVIFNYSTLDSSEMNYADDGRTIRTNELNIRLSLTVQTFATFGTRNSGAAPRLGTLVGRTPVGTLVGRTPRVPWWGPRRRGGGPRGTLTRPTRLLSPHSSSVVPASRTLVPDMNLGSTTPFAVLEMRRAGKYKREKAARSLDASELNRVKRNLFGTPDGALTRAVFEEEMTAVARAAESRWGFDFLEGRPSVSSRTEYVWTPVAPPEPVRKIQRQTTMFDFVSKRKKAPTEKRIVDAERPEKKARISTE